ncbi:calcium ATPase [Aspergillus japonicus CBS 114.51]|uniref:Calcium ATPase n=1 Tax=Aspergillus japonicus CBS 114.51 TaxID=1448312 RepID=A0A8T8X3D0_ASPJA|nr:calcium ATPase [Aspergillus japonicus CBS 114.51]RAH82440.1 calcium ATPase [Aspergillus japonicus CBS 114.51]
MEDHEKELPNGHQPSNDLSEYTALNRFISTTTTASHAAPSATDKDSDEPTSHPPRWKFWRQFHDSTDEKGGGPFQTPSEWLDTDISSGLSEAEVDERRKKCGWNELASESPNKLLQFIAYFRCPILYVMELALFLAAGLRDWIDFGVINGILMLNAIVGWYQEKQAADVVASLKGDLAMKAIVVRDGEEKEILAREVVVGDILILEEGNVIPAEARLICDYSEPDTFAAYREKIAQEGEDPLHEDGESSEDEHKHTEKAIVAADQSAITGESLAVDKFMGDVCYYTTSCKKGKAYAIVNASAKDSFVGRTASLVQTAKDQGHFKAVMDSIGTTLLTLILLIIGVPVGLPVVTTTTLAVGAAFLARKKAVVQKLTAIESLAGVNWGFSIGVVIVIATVYYLLSRITWLQNLGRANRSKEELKMERFLEQLFKLTVEREIDPKSENPRFVLKTRTEDIDADD